MRWWCKVKGFLSGTFHSRHTQIWHGPRRRKCRYGRCPCRGRSRKCARILPALVLVHARGKGSCRTCWNRTHFPIACPKCISFRVVQSFFQFPLPWCPHWFAKGYIPRYQRFPTGWKTKTCVLTIRIEWNNVKTGVVWHVNSRFILLVATTE